MNFACQFEFVCVQVRFGWKNCYYCFYCEVHSRFFPHSICAIVVGSRRRRYFGKIEIPNVFHLYNKLEFSIDN